MKRKPCLSNVYFYCAFLHEKAKKYFQKKNRNVYRLKMMLKELSFCVNAFQTVFYSISSEEIKTLSKNLDQKTIEKRKLRLIKQQCDH